MKVIIAGAHTFTDYQRLCQVLASDRHRITQVLTGGARGAELLGYRWAWKHAVRHQCFRADWERFGKAAGVRRNHQMAQAGDVLVVFGNQTSPGTAHLIQCMQPRGTPVVLVSIGSCTSPLRIIPSAQNPGTMPHLTTLWRGQGHGLASFLLPTRSVGDHMALRHVASP